MVSEHASPLATRTGVGVGGQHVHVAEVATEFGARGYDVRVYTRRDDAGLPDEVPFATGVVVEHVPAGPAQRVPKNDLLSYVGEFGRWLAARWSAATNRPDVVHAHHWRSGLAALTATATSRIPVAVTFHSLGSVRRRYLGDRDGSPDTRVGLERELGHQADRVVAQSADEVDELGRLGVPRGKIDVVAGGVDPDRFGITGPAVPRPPDGRPRILAVGRLAEHQGIADLVAALPLIPDAELTLVGGPVPDELDGDPVAMGVRALAAKIGVAQRVRLVGCVPPAELPGWYRSADVVACVPRYEPFGLAALEAMACGVPVVGYAVGGLAESVIDGVTGSLVPPREVRRLAGALRAVLGDQVLRMSYASAAADRIRSRYTWRRTADDLERVYAALTGGPLPGGEGDLLMSGQCVTGGEP
jgi:D-inositol-3-phosphate glycosyltransferase